MVCGPPARTRKIKNNICPQPEGAASPEGSGIFYMDNYDVTKLPFTSISRENWQMLMELDPESLYDVIQHIGNYVLSGECNCETTLSKVVCGQVISVIDRRGKGYWDRIKHLKQGKTATAGMTVKEEEIQQAPKMTDDEYFDAFFNDPAMDYSSLLTNPDYFKQRKKSALNELYLHLEKRYDANQIIQILQDKYTEKLNT